MIGTVLGNRYKLIAELGGGGMAWVYLAEDLREQQKVAVKVLYPQYGQDLGFLQRFVREAKLAMSLTRSPEPHIVRVLDYGADRDTHYLVMEFAPGQDLGHILEEQGPLTWQKALDIAHQVALALDHAHQHEVVHRDIKPSNIMILPGGTVQVLDFGIARARTSPEVTVSGFVGSPHYAAPEQATSQVVDIRADIYSLGVVLYRMLSGNLPFEGDSPWAVINQHISSPPPPLDEIRPELPESVVRLVQKAMAKRPEDRFQTPAEMAQAIQRILAGLGLPSEALATRAEEVAPTLEELYQRGRQAVKDERWQEAVDLFSRILKVDPNYRDVTGQLSEVGQQIRLAALYRSAQRALQVGHWDQAMTQLDKIAGIVPDYRDIKDLRAMAEGRRGPTVGERAAAAEFPTQIPTEDLDIQATAGTGDHPGEEPSDEGAPTPAPARRRPLVWAGVLVLLLILAAVGYLLLRRVQQPPAASPAPVAQSSPTPTLPPTASPVPTALAPSPTAFAPSRTPRPTHTSAASGVTVPPSPSPTSGPELTPTPTATSSPTPTSTASPTTSPSPTAPAVASTEPPLTGQIAFPRYDPTRGTYDVYICRIDGSGCRRVVAEASQPDFLPDGDQIVVHEWKPDEKGLVLHVLSEQRIWRITNQIEAARPCVDFEGKVYAYHSRQEADRQPRLYRTYNAEVRPILREASVVLGLSPSWLPDGRILYSGCWLDACGILAMRADGTQPRQIVAGSVETNPEASPDGRQVAFMSRRDGNWEVYIVNLDGSGLQRLTRHLANDGLPAWSPDGRHIAFVSDRDGEWAVWVMRPDGSEQRRLFGLGGPLDGRVQNAAPHETHGWVEERISWSLLP